MGSLKAFLWDRITLIIAVIIFIGAGIIRSLVGQEIEPKDVFLFIIIGIGYLAIYMAKLEFETKKQKCPGAQNIPILEHQITSISDTTISLCKISNDCSRTVEIFKGLLPKQEIEVLSNEDHILENGKSLCEDATKFFCWFNVPLGRIWREENYKMWLLPALKQGKNVHFILDKKWERYWSRVKELTNEHCPEALSPNCQVLTVDFFDKIESAYAVKIANIGDLNQSNVYRGQFWILDEPFIKTVPDYTSGEKIKITEPKIIFSFREDFHCIPMLLEKIGEYWQGYKSLMA